MTSPPMVGLSMVYLQEHDLEAAVCRALMAVVNERAANPLERMADLLLAENSTSPVAKREAATVARLEKQVANLSKENTELRAECRSTAAAASESASKAQKLSVTNAALQKKCEQLEQHGESLERWLHERDGLANGAAAMPPAPPKAEASTPAPARDPPAVGTPPTGASHGPASRLPAWSPLFFFVRDGSGVVTGQRLEAFALALEDVCDADAGVSEEIDAIRSFVKMLRGMAKGGNGSSPSYARDAWLAYSPPDGDAMSAHHIASADVTMDAILGNQASCNGLADAMAEQEVRLNAAAQPAHGATAPGEFADLMTRLYDAAVVRRSWAADTDGGMHSARLAALIDALKLANEDTRSKEEKAAQGAFIAVLEGMAEGGRGYDRDSWASYVPPPSAFTPEQQKLFMTTLLSILQLDDAVDGLREEIESKLELE